MGAELPRYPQELQPSTQDPGRTHQQHERSYRKRIDKEPSGERHGKSWGERRKCCGNCLWRHPWLAHIAQGRRPGPIAIAEPDVTGRLHTPQPAGPCQIQEHKRSKQAGTWYRHDGKVGWAPSPIRIALHIHITNSSARKNSRRKESDHERDGEQCAEHEQYQTQRVVATYASQPALHRLTPGTWRSTAWPHIP